MLQALAWVKDNSEAAIEFVVKIKGEIQKLYDDDLEGIQAVKELWQRQESWYVHLRYVEMFVRAGAFNMVKHHLDLGVSTRPQGNEGLTTKYGKHRLLKNDNFVRR